MSKIVFCGFGKLGKDCIEDLINNGYQITFILTHKECLQESVDTLAQTLGIEYSYLDSRKNLDKLKEKIKSINPDFLISVNYRFILPKEVYSLASYSLNIHGSLLPKYRGRTPHVWSIINGEDESGITCHVIEEAVDKGDIILQKKIPILHEDTGYSLLRKFELEYPKILIESIKKLESGTKLIKQDENLASYFGKRTSDMGYIDFRKMASEVINFVRAQAEPYPGAYYYLIDGRKIIINKIVVEENLELNIPVGVIQELGNDYFVRCYDYLLKIKDYRVIG